MKTLVAMDTKAVTGPELVKQYQKEEAPDFQNGDHTMTFIRTENGKTIHIQHDVMNPRPYSRMYQLTGTKGFANKYPIEQYCFRPDQLTAPAYPITKTEYALGCSRKSKRNFDEPIQTSYPPRIRRNSKENRWTWRDGLHYGLSLGILLAQRTSFGHGRL